MSVELRVLRVPRLRLALPKLLLLPIILCLLPILPIVVLLLVFCVGVALVLVEIIVLSVVLLCSLPTIVRALPGARPLSVGVCVPMGSIELTTRCILRCPAARPRHIVVLPRRFTGENVVGSRDLFKFLFIFWRTLDRVRVILLREIIVDPLDVCCVGAFWNTELGVIIDVL